MPFLRVGAARFLQTKLEIGFCARRNILAGLAALVPSVSTAEAQTNSSKLEFEIPAITMNLPVTRDQWTRPVSSNGTFYVNGKPEFLVSVNLGYNHAVNATGPKTTAAKRIVGDDPIYNQQLSAEICDEIGLKSVSIVCTPRRTIYANPFIADGRLRDAFARLMSMPHQQEEFSPEQQARRFGWLERLEPFSAEQVRRLKGLPLSPDFYPEWETGPMAALKVRMAGLSDSMLMSLNGRPLGGHMPYCPEDPIGREYYHAYFQNGAYWYLSLGANPWLYEFWNELHHYNCSCRYNQEMFLAWLRQRYASLDAVNRTWGTNFRSFPDIVAEKNYRTHKGLWSDWMKFMGDRWREVLLDARRAVRQVDARPNTYFTWEIANASLLSMEYGANIQGADCYKGAQVVDCFGLEGGVSFGGALETGDPSGDLLTQAMHGNGGYGHQFILDVCSGLVPHKPVVNKEAYLGRSIAGLGRQPLKRTDFLNHLWTELIHGSSLVEFFSWFWAKGFRLDGPTDPPYLNANLLNPWATPRESLEGIRDFNREMDKLGHLVLPRPRIRGTVALVHSQPTVWQNPPLRPETGRRQTVGERERNCHQAVLLSHYPQDVIFEERILDGTANHYMALIIPGNEYVFGDTVRALKAYVAGGGVLIVVGSGMMYDEYGHRLEIADLLGVVREELPEKLAGTLSPTFALDAVVPIRTDCFNRFLLQGAVPLATIEGTDRPCVSEFKVGKGKVYYVGIENVEGRSSTVLFGSLLRHAGISKPFELIDLKGEPVYNTEAHVLDRRDKQVFYFMNWDNLQSRLALLTPLALPEGKYYVTDLVSDRALLCGNSATWSVQEMARGIPVLLPAQMRSLLMVSSQPWEKRAGAVTWRDLETRLADLRMAEQAERVAVAGKVKDYQERNKR